MGQSIDCPKPRNAHTHLGCCQFKRFNVTIEQTDHAQRILSRYSRLGFLIGMTLLGIFWLIGNALLTLFGQQAIVGYRALLILYLSETAHFSLGLLISILSLSQLNRDLQRINVIVLLVSVLTTFGLITHLQYEGAAITLPLSLILRYGFIAAVVISKTPFRLQKY